MIYQMSVSHKADKDIAKLDQKTIRRIMHRLEELQVNPFDHRISGPVEMEKGERKSRVGDWRIVYEVIR